MIMYIRVQYLQMYGITSLLFSFHIYFISSNLLNYNCFKQQHLKQKNASKRIFNPISSRNKGCGSCLKSNEEISMIFRKMRTCSICNKVDGYNARTCPTTKKQTFLAMLLFIFKDYFSSLRNHFFLFWVKSLIEWEFKFLDWIKTMSSLVNFFASLY